MPRILIKSTSIAMVELFVLSRALLQRINTKGLHFQGVWDTFEPPLDVGQNYYFAPPFFTNVVVYF